MLWQLAFVLSVPPCRPEIIVTASVPIAGKKQLLAIASARQEHVNRTMLLNLRYAVLPQAWPPAGIWSRVRLPASDWQRLGTGSRQDNITSTSIQRKGNMCLMDPILAVSTPLIDPCNCSCLQHATREIADLNQLRWLFKQSCCSYWKLKRVCLSDRKAAQEGRA